MAPSPLTLVVDHVHRQLAAEIARQARYFDVLLWVGPSAVIEHVSATDKRVVAGIDEAVAQLEKLGERSVLVVLHGTINLSNDIEADLERVGAVLPAESQLVLVAWNPYMRALYQLASSLGVRSGPSPTTFVTEVDLRNLARLADLSVGRVRRVGYAVPARALRTLLSMTPAVREACFTHVVTLQGRGARHRAAAPGLSVIIPARNERGNIAAAVERLESWDRGPLEIVFVEGHSKDGTWDEIQRVMAAYRGRHRLVAHQQTGKGKADAVRLGFNVATQELVTILDADLTMPPELLVRFYDAYTQGRGDFINGSRLVYPMEDDSMRFLNRVGNGFFAAALSWVLDTRFGDTLCGTKLMRRSDWLRFMRWREDFGDFDPFGDFELLFAAAVFGLEIVDVPIQYRARTYGETQISRFRNGAQLLRMTAIGLLRIKSAN